ncbi:MAG: hypothetical protein WCT26_01750 [Candidatus Buchananbacteria bacterium]|jgi:hypothetical protein
MKKFLTYSVVVATIAWSMGISAVLPAAAAYTPTDGDLIKTATYPAVYYVTGGKKYLFVNRVTYTTWANVVGDANNNFAGLKVVSQADFDALSLGGNITARPGVSLVKFDNSANVYAVTPGAVLVKLENDAAKVALYGAAAPIVIQSSFEANYTKSATSLTATSMYPDGTLVKSGTATYLVLDGKLSMLTGDAYTANFLKASYEHSVANISGYTTGAVITGKVASMSNVVSGATAPVVTLGTLAVALASTNPGSTTLVSDTVNTSQALVPMLAVNLTASTAGDVKVTGMTFERTGISNDTDVSTSYLYDGTTKLVEGGSISSKVLTFNYASGIITIPAGQTKTVWLKIDTAINTSAGKSIGFNLTGVTSNATSVSGTAQTGNLMSTALVTDMGYAVISSGDVPTADQTTVNSNETDFEVYKVTLTATDQDMQLEGLRLTEIGSIGKDDLTNIKLMYGGTVLATASFNDNMELYFDLSSAPFQIAKGNSKTLSLRADIVKGSTRTFKFSIQYASDIVVKDKGYNVYTQSFKTSAVTWSAVTSAVGEYLINSGTITLAKDATSASGGVASNATNAKLATFKLTATGEDIKVKNLNVLAVQAAGAGGGLDNGKVYYDGVQVGSTKDLTASTTVEFTFGSSLIVPAGTSKLLDIYADIKTTGGIAITGGTVQISASSSDANGVVSLTALTAGTQSGNALTVGAVSTITMAKYAAYGAQTMPSPTSQAKIGSFTIAASASEGVTVENIYVSGATSGELSNMNLKVGSTIIGTKASFSATNASTTISVNTKLNLAQGETKVVDIYADIASGLNASSIILSVNADGTTPTTNTTANGTNQVLQTITVGNGSLTLDTNGAKPDSAIVVAGATTAVSAFTMLAANDSYTITNLTVTSTAFGSQSDRSIGAVILEYKNEAGSTVTATGYLSGGNATFNNLSIWVPKGVGTTVSVKAMIADATGAKSGDSIRLNLAPSDDTATTFAAISKATGSAIYAYTGTIGVTGNLMIVRKTKPTVSLVSLPSTVLADGTQIVQKFSIAADAAGDVTWKYIGFSYTSSTSILVTASTWFLYKDGDSTKLNATGLSSNVGGTLAMVVDNEQTIAKGTSQTYVLKADITGSAANTSFTTKITGTSDTAGTSTAYSNYNAVETMFRWSDRSGSDDDGVHTATSDDWCDSNYVKSLPTDSQTLSR